MGNHANPQNSKNSENATEPKLTPDEVINEKNKRVIHREFFNDVVGISLKLISFLWSTANVGAFKAELIRSCIDCLNHIALYNVNNMNKSDKELNERMKTAIVIIPGFLFIIFGGITFSNIPEVIINNMAVDAGVGHSLVPICCYLVTMVIEVVCILKNIQDATNTELNHGESLMSTLKNLTKLLGVKDPVLQAILMENIISTTSTLVPLVASFLYMFVPSCFWEAISLGIIATIQVGSGVHLIRNNTRPLIGFRIDEQTRQKISKTIQSSPYLGGVSDEKGTYTAMDDYKIEAKSSYNLEKLTEDVINRSKEAIERGVFARTPEARQYYITEILENTPKIIFRQIQKHEVNLEELLRKEYPNISDIDIDQEHLDLLHWDEQDKVKIIEELSQTGVDEPCKDWILGTTDKILGSNYTRQVEAIGLKKVDEHKMRNEESFYLADSNNNEYQHYDEFDTYEDIRFEILQKHLQDERKKT